MKFQIQYIVLMDYSLNTWILFYPFGREELDEKKLSRPVL